MVSFQETVRKRLIYIKGRLDVIKFEYHNNYYDCKTYKCKLNGYKKILLKIERLGNLYPNNYELLIKLKSLVAKRLNDCKDSTGYYLFGTEDLTPTGFNEEFIE